MEAGQVRVLQGFCDLYPPCRVDDEHLLKQVDRVIRGLGILELEAAGWFLGQIEHEAASLLICHEVELLLRWRT